MKLALRNALVVFAIVAIVPMTGCTKLFKKTLIPVASGTPIPSNPPTQATCVQGTSAQDKTRHTQALTQATLSIDSNPHGLQVEINGAYMGATPRQTTPPYSANLNKITILNQNGGSDYQLCYSQAAGPNLNVFYNRSADTPGKITSIQDAVRSPQAVLATASGSIVRRGVQSGEGASSDYSGASIEVRYRRGAIHALRAGNDIAPDDAPYGIRVVHTSGDESLGSAIAKLQAQPGVVSAEAVQKRYTKSKPPIATPNDPHFGTVEQWDMYQIQALNGWSYTLGSPTVKIAIIDTGLDTSPTNTMVQADLIPKLDFTESVLTGGANCDGAQVVTTGQAAVQDMDGHGTNVAGIAAAVGNNGSGFVGVGWNVSLQIYRVFSRSGACTSDEAKAIMDAVANGARVINLSLGSTQAGGPDQAEHDAVLYAIAHNVLVVAAAGNERGSVQNLDFPGAYPGVLAVGATSLNDSNTGNPAGAKEFVASYSNAGPGLGLVAPGGDPSSGSDNDLLHWISNLYSTTGSPPCSTPSNCRVLIAGTSQATPHVAGAAGLLLSANPALTATQLVNILEGTADDIGDVNQGHGRLNIYRALAAVTGDVSPPPYKPANAQFIAFAYTNSGATNAAPTIADVTFSGGILVNQDGTFRIADVPTTLTSYKIGVWYDANGDGVVDAGDRFAASGACTQTGPCSGAGNLSPSVISSASFQLP